MPINSLDFMKYISHGAIGRVWVSSLTYVDDSDTVFRQFACPGCGTLLETGSRYAACRPLHDKRLHDKQQA